MINDFILLKITNQFLRPCFGCEIFVIQMISPQDEIIRNYMRKSKLYPKKNAKEAF